MSNAAVEASAGAPLESAAFPPFLRYAAIVLMVALFIGALLASPEMRRATWTASGLALMAAAWVSIAWFGYWLLHSRTRLEADTLTQTWIWTKRCRAADVASLKLVHLQWIDGIVAPRLLVRQRNGALLWFQAADSRILRGFAERVARQRLPERGAD